MIRFFVSGQVDSGKSTLIGHLLYLTKEVSQLDSTSSEVTKYSDLLDQDASERERGITQWASTSYFQWQGKQFVAIDTPGHLLYIRQLIQAISENKGAIGVLLISSVPNEFRSMFVSGTTKEDTLLMRCCGVNHLVVVLNKIDKPNSDAEQVQSQFQEWVKKLRFKSITFVQISAFQGLNLIIRSDPLKPSLLEVLINIPQKIPFIIPQTIGITKNKSKIKVDFHTFDISKIIAIGYQGVFHLIGDKYSEVIGEIAHLSIIPNTNTEIINKKKRFLKSNEHLFLYVILEEEKEITQGQRVILREDRQTIGFGYIILKNVNNES